jgi:hypothetical protein
MHAEADSDPSRKRRTSEGTFPARVRLLGGFGVWVGSRAVGEGVTSVPYPFRFQIAKVEPGETPYLISNTTTATPSRTESVLGNGLLEGECGYRPSY